MLDSPAPLIFVVDDDVAIRQIIALWMAGEGYDCKTFSNGPDALEALKISTPDVVCLDLWMEPMNGSEVMARFKEIDDMIPILFFTGEGSVEKAVSIMRAGAHDYQIKPLKRDRLLISLRNALRHRNLQCEVMELRAQLAMQQSFGGLIGRSEAMKKLFRQLRKVSRTAVSVMVQGESGTGKELIARAIHQYSSRSDGPFVALNCGAVPESLLESELFGHKRGAFTGASQDRKGKFEQAHGGTLFLDEIAELSPAAQVRLLRVLQEGEFEPVGSNRTIKIDVRVISATHRDLDKRIESELFRHDLYYRLMVYPIEVPPLRERFGDVSFLAMFFLEKHHPEVEGRPQITAETLSLLQQHRWPGNVRELENVISFALVSVDGDEITPRDLPPKLRRLLAMASAPEMGPHPPASSLSFSQGEHNSVGFSRTEAPKSVPMSMEEIERQAIIEALEESEGNVSKAARRLGLGRTTLYRKMAQFGLRDT